MDDNSGCLFKLLIATLLVSLAYSITGYSMLLNVVYLFGAVFILTAVISFFTSD